MEGPTERPGAQEPLPDPDPGFATTARAVIAGQLRLAERLSEDFAGTVLAHADATRRLTSLLREALRDSRRSRTTLPGHKDPAARPPGAGLAAQDAGIDEIIARIETALLDLAAEAQCQDAMRQVIDGVATLAEGVIEAVGPPDGPGAQSMLIARLDRLAERFVMEEQRDAYAMALGRPPAESTPRLELF